MCSTAGTEHIRSRRDRGLLECSWVVASAYCQNKLQNLSQGGGPVAHDFGVFCQASEETGGVKPFGGIRGLRIWGSGVPVRKTRVLLG